MAPRSASFAPQQRLERLPSHYFERLIESSTDIVLKHDDRQDDDTGEECVEYRVEGDELENTRDLVDDEEHEEADGHGHGPRSANDEQQAVDEPPHNHEFEDIQKTDRCPKL